MAIDAKKDSDLILTRKNFDVISHIDSDTRAREVNLLREKLAGALKRYLVRYPHERERFEIVRDGIDNITNVYAESLFETSYVLGIKDFGLELEEIKREVSERPFGTIDFAYTRKGEDGNFIVGINAHLFFDQANEWDYSPTQRKVILNEICGSMAEEITHLYVASKYPLTDVRSTKANIGSWNEYSADRGENFAKVFANKYLEYKKLVYN